MNKKELGIYMHIPFCKQKCNYCDFYSFKTDDDSKKKYIDSDLLKNRHGIVHGEKLFIDIKDFDNTYKIILDIMEMFSNKILNAALSKEPTKVSKVGGVNKKSTPSILSSIDKISLEPIVPSVWPWTAKK